MVAPEYIDQIDVSTTPTVFKNKLVGGSTYLVQHADKLGNCIRIITVWKRYGYNVRSADNITDEDVDIGDPINLKLYAYASKDQISRLPAIRGDDFNSDSPDVYEVIVYKYNDKYFYAAMLSLDDRGCA